MACTGQDFMITESPWFVMQLDGHWWHISLCEDETGNPVLRATYILVSGTGPPSRR